MIQVDWWTWTCALCGWKVESERTVNNQQVVAEAIVRAYSAARTSRLQAR